MCINIHIILGCVLGQPKGNGAVTSQFDVTHSCVT